ncbi:MAG: TlpA disulfide reductase family protein [Armatimonadota bacterium]|nr:TlpA disulfide reductase family protein [Armatimonadota bacterium]
MVRPSGGTSPSRALLLLAAAFFVVAGVIVAYSLGQRSAVEDAPIAPGLTGQDQPLRIAPAFSLPSLRGPGRVSLADFRGQVVVLNFFASWCRPCELEAADLERTWQATRGRGVAFVGIAIQDEPEAARGFLARHGISYPAAIDTSGEIMRAYRVTGIPTTFFVTPDGRIAGTHVGIFVGDEGVARLRERIGRARSTR